MADDAWTQFLAEADAAGISREVIKKQLINEGVGEKLAQGMAYPEKYGGGSSGLLSSLGKWIADHPQQFSTLRAAVGLVGTAGVAGAFGGGTFAGNAGGAAGSAGSIGASGAAGGTGIGAGAAAGGGSAASAGTGAAASGSFLSRLGSSALGRSLIQGTVGALINKFSGRPENALRDFVNAPYESNTLQKFLPPELRAGTTGPILERGVANIGELIRNPGGLSPTVSAAIAPRLAAESSRIAQEYRGIGSNQAGALARGNAPISIKGALASALDTAQERAQRGARMSALSESEDLRRRDVSQTYGLLDAILNFQQAGRGGAIPGLGQAASLANNRQAANLAFIGSLFGQARNP